MAQVGMTPRFTRMVSLDRRELLKTAGSVAIVGTVAGCTGGGNDGSGDSGDDNASQTENGSQNRTEDDGNGSMGMAMVRVAHLSPDAPNVDVYVDDEVVLEDVAYRAVSDYLELEPGTYGVQITAAGDRETVVFDEDVEVTEGAFTLAAVGELEGGNQSFDVLVLEDDATASGDSAAVRILHAAPDAPEVDVVNTGSGDALAEGLAFGDTATFEVPGGSYTLGVRPAGGEETVAEFDVEVAGGTVYSAFAVGYLEPEDASVDESFALEVVEGAQ